MKAYSSLCYTACPTSHYFSYQLCHFIFIKGLDVVKHFRAINRLAARHCSTRRRSSPTAEPVSRPRPRSLSRQPLCPALYRCGSTCPKIDFQVRNWAYSIDTPRPEVCKQFINILLSWIGYRVSDRNYYYSLGFMGLYIALLTKKIIPC